MAELYKAQVWCRWRNRLSGTEVELVPGAVVEFEDGDFDEDGGRPTGALRSLDDVLARGVFVGFDPATAGDPEHMSRDEMLHVLRARGVLAADGSDLPHNADEGQLRPMVAAALAQAADGQQGKPAGKRRGRRGGS